MRKVAVADDEAELQLVLQQGADLLLLNRELPEGFADNQGASAIRRLKGAHPQLKMMLVSNYPEAQAAAAPCRLCGCCRALANAKSGLSVSRNCCATC